LEQGILITKGGSITVPITSSLTGLEPAVSQLTIFVFICKTDKSKPVKQEVNGTVILPPLVFPDVSIKILQRKQFFLLAIKTFIEPQNKSHYLKQKQTFLQIIYSFV
jgi:hypothetical protein